MKDEELKKLIDKLSCFDYMCSIDNYYRLNFYHEYATLLPQEYQVKLIPYYMEALRQEAASANKSDRYKRVR